MSTNAAAAALVAAGLTQTEAETYLCCLRTGMAQGGAIVRALGIPRATAYGALAGLVEKGFVSKLEKNGVALFNPELPQKAANIAQKRAEEAGKAAAQLRVDEIQARRATR